MILYLQTYWSTGLHLWTPLPFNSVFKGLGNNFRTHFFYNMGNFNSFSTGKQENIFKILFFQNLNFSDSMRSAAGIGLAFKLAERARIELNYCIPVRKFEGDKPVRGFQFGIGYEFV